MVFDWFTPKNIRVSSNDLEAKSQFTVHDLFMSDSWFANWFQNNDNSSK